MSGALFVSWGKNDPRTHTKFHEKEFSVTWCDLVDRLLMLQWQHLEIIAKNNPATLRVDSVRVLCGYNELPETTQ
jgi:hypothetical protein